MLYRSEGFTRYISGEAFFCSKLNHTKNTYILYVRKITLQQV
jgi:hypothetical protein